MRGLRWALEGDRALAALALLLMTALPLVELTLRPLFGRGVDNAPLVVQHLGLVMAMAGALAAARHGHLTTLGTRLGAGAGARSRAVLDAAAGGLAAAVCGALACAAWRLVDSERQAAQELAYGLPVWWAQAAMPLGFALLGLRLGWRSVAPPPARVFAALAWPLAGVWAAWAADGRMLPAAPGVTLALVLLATGAPVFAAMGALALALAASEALPLASVALSHYQITVNPSLPALPLFTLAGLLLARSGAAQRLGTLFVALFGGGVRGTVAAAAALCSAFTAFTGGSGVTILALGGLLLPLLNRAGYPERRGIGLVTSASALGVLLAPSVPLIMVAVIARVPIETMFLAGLLPALVMVLSLLTIGGFLRREGTRPVPPAADSRMPIAHAAWQARWELAAPLVAIGSLSAGLATPTESAALTAGYALLTQALLRRELAARRLFACVADSAMIIGGVMLILGLALALTNWLVDAGIPDAMTEAVQRLVPQRHLFLLLLCGFLFAAAALMEIYAAIVVLVPLLLPLARAYGMDPVHFGIVFLAAMEVGFLCPPAGMNLYFAASMFRRPIGEVAVSVLPAMLAIFAGTVLIALVPQISTALPALLTARAGSFGP